MSFYFQNFKITEYKFNDKTYDLTNITLRYKFKKVIKNFEFAFHDYTMREGENLSSFSDSYYGSSEYTWLIILCNDILDPYYGFHLDQRTFRKYIVSKYGSWEYAEKNIHHFERHSIYKNETEKMIDLDKPIVIDQKVYENSYNSDGTKKYPNLEILFEKEKRYITILEYETEINDNKRNIKVLDSDYLSVIEEISEKIFD